MAAIYFLATYAIFDGESSFTKNSNWLSNVEKVTLSFPSSWTTKSCILE
jgi:hypothetical protein